LQLFEDDEFHIVDIDHHAVMIDPTSSFQAHTPLEETFAWRRAGTLVHFFARFSQLDLPSARVIRSNLLLSDPQGLRNGTHGTQ
jgi:hypothetical protein